MTDSTECWAAHRYRCWVPTKRADHNELRGQIPVNVAINGCVAAPAPLSKSREKPTGPVPSPCFLTAQKQGDIGSFIGGGRRFAPMKNAVQGRLQSKGGLRLQAGNNDEMMAVYRQFDPVPPVKDLGGYMTAFAAGCTEKAPIVMWLANQPGALRQCAARVVTRKRPVHTFDHLAQRRGKAQYGANVADALVIERATRLFAHFIDVKTKLSPAAYCAFGQSVMLVSQLQIGFVFQTVDHRLKSGGRAGGRAQPLHYVVNHFPADFEYREGRFKSLGALYEMLRNRRDLGSGWILDQFEFARSIGNPIRRVVEHVANMLAQTAAGVMIAGHIAHRAAPGQSLVLIFEQAAPKRAQR